MVMLTTRLVVAFTAAGTRVRLDDGRMRWAERGEPS